MQDNHKKPFFHKKLKQSVVALFISFPYLCHRKTRGAHVNSGRAEIIPCEPDAVSTAEGIVTSYLIPSGQKCNSLYLQVNS